MEPYHSIPMMTGLLYTIGALCIKRATTNGIGPWRTTFVSNLVLFLAATPLWFLGDPLPDFSQLWMPVCVGVFFFLGQLLSCLAIHKGDVSLFTPLMGMKTIFIAFTVWIGLGEDLRLSVWVGAIMSAVAVLVMRSGGQVDRSRVALTISLGLACSLSFAFADSGMQAFGGAIGFHKLAVLSVTVVMLLSFALLPLFSGSVREISGRSWSWLLLGAGTLALQAGMMAYVLTVHGKATVVNVIYSSRGIWSVVLVWAVGHWFSNQEQGLGKGVLGRRLLGATLLLLAIVAVMG